MSIDAMRALKISPANPIAILKRCALSETFCFIVGYVYSCDKKRARTDALLCHVQYRGRRMLNELDRLSIRLLRMRRRCAVIECDIIRLQSYPRIDCRNCVSMGYCRSDKIPCQFPTSMDVLYPQMFNRTIVYNPDGRCYNWKYLSVQRDHQGIERPDQ